MDSKKTFCVGFSRVCITPEESVPLAGFFNSSFRMSNNVLDDIYADCIAMTDEADNTVLLVEVDVVEIHDEALAMMREHICKATGLQPEQLILSDTHTHSSVDLENVAEPSVVRYLDMLMPKLAQLCVDALADRKSARIFTGHVMTESLNFVKHYKHTLPDGTVKYFGDNFGKTVLDETTVHTTQADPTMHLVKFVREGGKDVVLANWRAHAQLTAGVVRGDLSSDFVGPFRDVLEAQMNCHATFLQGGCGNINPHSRIKEEMYTTDHRVYGARLAYFAVKGLENNMKEIEPGLIRTKKVMYAGEVNHADDHLFKIASEIKDVFDKTGDGHITRQMGAPYGIRTPYHALSIVDRALRTEDIYLELNAVAIGDSLAIVTAPNEIFDTNSHYVETHSPFETTLSLSFTNGYQDYLPSKLAYEHTSYETDSSRFKPGIGEEVQDTFLQMLQELKGQ